MKSGIFTSDILHQPSYIIPLTSSLLHLPSYIIPLTSAISHQPSALLYFSGTPCVFFTSFITNTLWK